ncbi:glutamyl-tRNA amidotransferase [Kosmotoga arenicorallina S304]|uniref:Glutamyl-tRNA(Gln) amidotransferase subunit A n=1 Tax=Kosmotoga arenicorallina S304 TaxID=1453497 RepID=A0A176K0G2_9BACT|nr:Asp-tRNA(Asn)/Glu-tRNA(Gln) amidotransferase subunit GatA [Kosmotoga arenicorallina]OAA30113.1 glutamyl-tRNA amidotransferase [Kosmotoga arenicorallina S304]
MKRDFLNYKIAELSELQDDAKRKAIAYFHERITAFNPELNAFLEVLPLSANYSSGSLSGIPYALKDNILARGTRTTCASDILKDYISPYDATVTARLKAEGAVLMGKTNLDEFAMGSSTENSAFGPSKNPWDLNRIPGGSSGGSAAAVAAGLVPFALGSDTGGSVRQPAAFCGVVGYKPSYGLVSRYGLVAFASSLDQIGPLTRCVDDAYAVFKTIARKDINDATTINNGVNLKANDLPKIDLKGIRIAVPSDALDFEGLDERVKSRFLEFVERLTEKGAKVSFIELGILKYVVATYYLIAPGEASSNLSRYDGVRYGERVESENYEEMIKKNRDIGFGDEVKRRILLGTFTLSSAYYDAYYRRALKIRRIISDRINKVLQEHDFILNPTTPTLPGKIGEISDPLTYYLMDIYTIPANLAGMPAISVPIDPVDGLPVGVQFMGKRLSDLQLLSVAKEAEKLSGAYENGLAKLPERWLHV